MRKCRLSIMSVFDASKACGASGMCEDGTVSADKTQEDLGHTMVSSEKENKEAV